MTIGRQVMQTADFTQTSTVALDKSISLIDLRAALCLVKLDNKRMHSKSLRLPDFYEVSNLFAQPEQGRYKTYESEGENNQYQYYDGHFLRHQAPVFGFADFLSTSCGSPVAIVTVVIAPAVKHGFCSLL